MNKEIENYIHQFKPHIKSQVNYMNEHPWVNLRGEDLVDEEDVHEDLAKSALNKLSYFTGKVTREDRYSYKKIQNFIELLADIVFIYIQSADDYLIRNMNWGEIQDAELKKAELKFQNELLENLDKFNNKLTKLNIENKLGEIEVPIHSGKIIPLLMRNIMEVKFPDIVEYLMEREANDQ